MNRTRTSFKVFCLGFQQTDFKQSCTVELLIFVTHTKVNTGNPVLQCYKANQWHKWYDSQGDTSYSTLMRLRNMLCKNKNQSVDTTDVVEHVPPNLSQHMRKTVLHICLLISRRFSLLHTENRMILFFLNESHLSLSHHMVETDGDIKAY